MAEHPSHIRNDAKRRNTTYGLRSYQSAYRKRLAETTPATLWRWDFTSGKFTDDAATLAAGVSDDVAVARGLNGDLIQTTPADRPISIDGGLSFAGAEWLEFDDDPIFLDGFADPAQDWEAALVFNVTDPDVAQVFYTFAKSDAASNNHEIAYLRIQSGGVLRFYTEDDASSQSNVTTTGSGLLADTDYGAILHYSSGDLTLDIYDDTGLIFTKTGALGQGNKAFDRFTLGMLRRTGTSSGSFMTGEIKDLELRLL